MLIGAGYQIAFMVEKGAIGTACILPKNRKLAICIILPYLVIGLVGKEYISLFIYRRAFRKSKLFGDELRLFISAKKRLFLTNNRPLNAKKDT
jgi:hypothetical protein